MHRVRYEVRDKLFGVFQRLHRAEDYEGTGVGLAIVQRIVQRTAADLRGRSAGQGATFSFTLAGVQPASSGPASPTGEPSLPQKDRSQVAVRDAA